MRSWDWVAGGLRVAVNEGLGEEDIDMLARGLPEEARVLVGGAVDVEGTDNEGSGLADTEGDSDRARD